MRVRLSQADGFTVLELLVVLAIATLTLSLAQPLLQSTVDRLRLEAAASSLMSALKVTRATAIARNAEVGLVLNLDERAYGSASVPKRILPAKVDLALKVAGLTGTTPSQMEIRFYPDGSSTGGELSLRLGDRSARICVHWLTGLAREDCS